MKKKYTKSEIIKMIKGMFHKNKLMFAYYCGSEAYHTKDDNSDTDVIAVFSDITGVLQMSLDDIDIFIYGVKDYHKRFSMSEELPLYNRIFVDDYLYARDNLIYLDPKYEGEFNKVMQFDFSKIIVKYLEGVIEYFNDLLIVQGIIVKRNYHLFRIHEVVKRYIKTNVYQLTLEESTHEVIRHYKATWQDKDENYLNLLKELLAEIVEFKEYIKEHEKK